MQKYFIIDPPTGYKVYLDPIGSDAGKYLSQRPYVMGLILEVLEKMTLGKESETIEHEMGRQIGTTDIVSTDEKDSIYFAKQIKKTHYSRFAKNRVAEKSSLLSIVLVRDIDGNYEVSDAWIGKQSPKFPGHELEADDSIEFWQSHALVHEALPIQTKTLTKDWPY